MANERSTISADAPSGMLRGQRALVTGAGRGVGSAIARTLAAEGAALALAYRGSKDGAEATVAEIRAAGGVAYAFQADLADPAQAEGLVAQAHDALGGLDTLVNNAAGFGPLKPLAEYLWDEIDAEFQAVVRPVFLTTRAALPILRAQRRGRVVNLTATLLQRPARGQGAHAMAKAAVLAYTRTLAREVGPDGITVNAVAPGMALTEFSRSLPQAHRDQIAALTPLRRLAEPEDVARVVALFCSPLADFVTGATLAADGGLAVL